MYGCLQPADMNLNVKILSRFPKNWGEIVETINLAKLCEEQLLDEIQKLGVKESNVIRMQGSMRKLSETRSSTACMIRISL